ncbi:hypothetical protein [Sphingobacterium lumbrici]|uniref:hypothetical protein n=1 Tax=Sphingobacterium lumbrici TaxID=2559600 RepID=UPI00112966BE|nr:hypothetical protein [Sphingobacterium lumbrici]
MKWFILFFLALFLHISNGQEQKSENKKKVYNISFDESPAQADSAMKSNFDTILTKFNMELNPHSGFNYLKVGKRATSFYYDEENRVFIGTTSFHFINSDSTVLIAIYPFDIQRAKENKRLSYLDRNENLFKEISGIELRTSLKCDTTEKDADPYYAYFNADKIGVFQLQNRFPAEMLSINRFPLPFMGYYYQTSYYMLRKDVGYFLIYQFTKEPHEKSDTEYQLPKLFRFK